MSEILRREGMAAFTVERQFDQITVLGRADTQTVKISFGSVDVVLTTAGARLLAAGLVKEADSAEGGVQSGS